MKISEGDLLNFTGSEVIYKDTRINFLFTEGIKFLLENGMAWAVTDVMAVIKSHPPIDFNGKQIILNSEPFLTVDFINDFSGKTKPKMVITDGNDNVYYEQKYEFFETGKVEKVRLFYYNNTLMLASEY